MKKLSILAAALFAAGACSDSPTRVNDAAPPASAANSGNTYIVIFKDVVGNPDALTNQLALAHSASVEQRYSHAVKGFAASMSAAAAEALTHNPNVLLVEQDQEVTAISTQTLDGSGEPWGLDRIDARSGLDATYTYAQTGAGVHAYIIDTGIRSTHSEFGGRASGGMTSIDDGNGTNDCDGHGTHVAGTIGGSTYGVAKSVQLVAVRVLDCRGSGSWSGVIAGIDWVTANAIKPAVANMSLGGGASSAVDLAVENSIAAGVTYAVAAGNGNNGGIAQNACNYSPSRTPNALTIGATSKTDVKTSWSNYGSCVDWFAPGLNIKSAWNTDDNATNTISGTSMATPHTTGVVVLFLEANPGASPADVRAGLFAALTKNVVTSSSTTNNHLLYAPPAGFGPPPANVAPTAAFTSSCTNLVCNFTDGSTDNDGSVASRLWDFGDGTSSTATNPSHTYSTAGTFSVTLSITDNGGLPANVSHDVVTSNPPPPSSITLNVTMTKVKSDWTATLTWSGATTTNVDVYRNGAKIKTVANSGSTTDSGKGGTSFTYRVCEAGTSVCSNNFVTQ